MRAGETPPAFLLEMMLVNKYVTSKMCFYNGRWYRSVAEAKTAMAFDKLGIPFEYERYACLSDDYDAQIYTPDFYLPELGVWIEVTGRWDAKHAKKAAAFVSNMGMSGMSDDFEKPVKFVHVDGRGDVFQIRDGGKVEPDCYVNVCRKCGATSFMTMGKSFACPSCGAYDGDHFCRFNRNLFDAAGVRTFEGQIKVNSDGGR